MTTSKRTGNIPKPLPAIVVGNQARRQSAAAVSSPTVPEESCFPRAVKQVPVCGGSQPTQSLFRRQHAVI